MQRLHLRTTFPVIFYMITVIIVVGALFIDGVVKSTWPTIDLIRGFEMPGLVFEWFESLHLVIWIMQIFSNFTISYYAAAFRLSQLFKINIQPIIYRLLLMIYTIAITLKNFNQLVKVGDFIDNSALFLVGLLPLSLLVPSKVRRGKQ
ncbi:GerAB/ArcD/ProY family transporter [Bacillus swezeyi]|nr:GerAB/ArcD/ProY family transporter [Bacillus swezeyi]